MDTTQLALLALLLGVIIGGSVSMVIVLAMRARDRAQAETSSVIPDGVREVLHGMDDAAVVVDASSTVLAASAAAVPFHLEEGGVLPSDELRGLARRVRSAESAATATLRLRRGAPPAEPRLVVVRATRISPRLTLLVLRDITERERVEQMRRDFVANTSHELKTPVGAVSLLAEAIESAADDPDQVRIFAGTADGRGRAARAADLPHHEPLAAAGRRRAHRGARGRRRRDRRLGGRGARDPGRIRRRRDRARRRARTVRARRRAGARARPSATSSPTRSPTRRRARASASG